MKLTWFGGTTIRLHVGGKILVAGGEGAPAEVLSGADGRFALDEPALIDPQKWRPRKAGTALDEAPLDVALHRVGTTSVLVDAVGEPPLILVAGDQEFGRWADGAVVVLFGGDIVSRAASLLQM